MPVIGRGDLYGVNVRARQQFAKILVGRAILVAVILVHGLLALPSLGIMHVADGRDLDFGIPTKRAHVARALDAQADAPEHHAVRRCHGVCPAQDGRRNDQRKAEGTRRGGRSL